MLPLTCMVSQVMWRKDFLLHGIYLQKTLKILTCFQLPLLHPVPYFFFLYQSPSFSVCLVFNFISSNIDGDLSVNPPANVFVFGDFRVHHKDWLTSSGRTGRPGELCHNFSISNDLTQMANCTTWISNCDSHSLALLDLNLLFSSNASICCCTFPSLKTLIVLLP